MIKRVLVSKIKTAYQYYKDFLVNKIFLVVFEENDCYNFVEIKFQKSNFLHLTGVKYSKTPNDFYNNIENETLSPSDITEQNFTGIKLRILPSLVYSF